MKPFHSPLALFGIGVAAVVLVACSKSEPLAPQPAAKQAAAPAAAPAPVQIAAPAGKYELDPAHSSLSFRINHLGLSTYVARFTRYNVGLNLDPANPAAASVTATIDATSVRTDYPGDYKAGHADSPYGSWDEDLAQSPKFFNAGAHPQITFSSTAVEEIAPGKLRITGNLALLGQTHPVTLEATLVGSAAAHPFTNRGAVGFSATGSFNRSGFGMTHLLQPLLVGDAVTVQFEGEFHQAAAPAPSPAPSPAS